MAIKNITLENYKQEVTENTKTVLMDFWAPWCGPCRMLSPVLEEIAAEREDIDICKINVDEQPELASMFQVVSIPMLVVAKEGKIRGQSVGYRGKRDVLSML